MKFRNFITISFIVMFAIFSGSVESSAQSVDHDVASGEAQVWYLYNDGYAVKTSDHFLIFDYWEPLESVDGLTLKDGVINWEEIKDYKVRVFVTHSHQDHFDKRILEWQDKVADIKYFFGWQAFDTPDYHYLKYPRGTYKDDSMEVFTVNSHHSGVPEAAFLVSIDGLRLFHVGDYRGIMAKGERSNVKEDVACLLRKISPAEKIDMLFLNAWYGEYNAVIVDNLKPGYIFPMHCAGTEVKEFAEFKQQCVDSEVQGEVLCPQKRGDSFVFSRGKMKSVN